MVDIFRYFGRLFMQVLVYDFRWESTDIFEFQASKSGRFGTKPLQVGSDISLAVKSEVRCAGSRRDGDFQPCPNNVVGRKKCETCRAREGSFVITSFDGFNSSIFTPEDLARLDGDHVVYLALFNKDLIKVGVSKLERKALRQVEQGSHFTLYIAQTTDGILARQIETLFRQHGLADKIPASSKKDFLCPEITLDTGESLLREIFEANKKCLNHQPHLADFLLHNPEFSAWDSVYRTSYIDESPKSFHTVSLKDDEWVSGRIVACKGPFLVIETPDELVSLCAKDLLGREVEFDPLPPGLGLNSAFQSALF